MAGDGPGRAHAGWLEALSSELRKRDFRTVLATSDQDEPELDVISPRLTSLGVAVSGARVYWHDGAMRWTRPEPITEPLPSDVVQAAERISAALQWSRQYQGLAPAAPPDT
ncbi:MAG: hypothetical protein ACRDPY_15290 [Streptosporangiaceae bacterium]